MAHRAVIQLSKKPSSFSPKAVPTCFHVDLEDKLNGFYTAVQHAVINVFDQ